MDVLVIGGTVFLGRAVVGEALARGDRVTVFNRGRSGSAPDGVRALVGDRSRATDLDQLADQDVDLVVDTCGYIPAEVAASAQRLVRRCGRYCFISTISVYPDWPARLHYQDGGVYDGDADAQAAPDQLDAAASYGWLKAGCERAVLRAFGSDRCSILRAGSIVGPYDSVVGRLPWWLHRVALGGEILVPGSPADPIALVDARDLARFALSGGAGVFEVGGPRGRDTRADLMAACVAAAAPDPGRAVHGATATDSGPAADATLRYVGDEWLAAQDVAPWTELPLWAPGAAGVFEHDTSDAAAAGMTWRPLRDTVADTWHWQSSLSSPWRPTERTPGLSPQRETHLLRAWRDSQA